MILLIDNYDSFSYNLYQLIGALNPDIKVVRNDAITPDEIGALAPEGIILSPGPGKPEDAGICIEVVKTLGSSIPILGICLGHQAICTAFGATVSYAKTLMHGKQSVIRLDTTCQLFYDCPETVPVARYHSLAVVESTIPKTLVAAAKADDGEIMAVKHINYEIYGVQFHPESIMTPDGQWMLKNFLNIAKERDK
ncbi:MAG: anthranilate synthase component II [Desulfosporosinus sp.]|jgi:anthranilate synthase component 2